MQPSTHRTDLRALLIEDSELDAGLLLRELSRAGFDVKSRRVQTAADLQAALAAEPWDVVLSDFKMPKFNGMEALAIVQASGLDVPFILISGAVGEETAVAAMRAGASDYFVKTRLATLGPAISRELREAVDRRARREADEQVRKLNHAVEQAPVSLMITDLAGRIEYVNPQFTLNTGYTLAEVKGQNPRLLKSGLMPPEFYRHLWQTITAGQIWQGEMHNRTKDGRLVWELVSISPIRDASGQATHYLGAKLDITNLRRTNEKIREQAALLDISNDAIYVRQLDGVITFWNSGAERLYGWSRAEALGRKITGLNLQELSADAESGGLLQQQGFWSGELRQSTHDGTKIEVLSRVTLVKNERGEPAYVFAINTDITEKKKLEEQFLHAQRLESLGMLASGIAHDLNNVLAPIVFAGPMLRPSLSTARDLKILATLERSAERGTGLVKQILGFARGATGDFRPMQVKHLARDIIEVLEQTFPKSIRIEHSVPSDLWPVLGNPTQIHQILLNLCVNARDAMPDGGKLRLALANRRLDEAQAATIPHACAGAWLTLAVSDTGTGIAPEILARIWEPFFTTKAPDKGTGLGLSTVRSIVTNHRGFITVDTQPDHGTTFRVYLPATLAEPATSVGATGAAIPEGHGELILVVDDDAAVRDTVSALVAKQNYRVLCAGDGVQALEHFTKHTNEVALVITDVDMPILGGAALGRILAQLRPDLPLLVMSGLSSALESGADVATAKKLGHVFLQKPFTAATLLATVHDLLHPTPAA